MHSIESANIAAEAIREQLVEVISEENGSFEASKLALIHEWRGVGLTILGTRITGTDVLFAIITIFAIWGVTLLGFDWLV